MHAQSYHHTSGHSSSQSIPNGSACLPAASPIARDDVATGRSTLSG